MSARRYWYDASVTVGLLAGSLAAAGPGLAAEASAWVPGTHSAARLLEAAAVDTGTPQAGAPDGAGPLLAGIEVRLDPHFITYWRNPGDAGVPPSFDFAASTNLASAEVLYPAPESFDEAGAQAFGYRGSVVFPVRVTPRDPAKPVGLKVQFDYAACFTICVPARATLRLGLDGRPSADGDRVTAALAAVPRRAPLGAVGPLPHILAVRPDPGEPAGERYLVEAVTGQDDGTLFVEAPEGWAYAAETPVQGSGSPQGLRQLLFPVKRLDGPKGQLRPSGPVTLTLVTSSGAIEVSTQLDAGRVTP